MKRNAIYSALLAQLQALQVGPYQVQVISQGFVPWDQADLQPAIYIDPRKEISKYVRGTPIVWTLHMDLWVYVKWADSVEQGTTELANIMDGVDAILSPTGPNGSPQTAVNTLGGLVTYCALQGEGDVTSGALNKQQAIARMPVEILVPG